MKKLFVLVLLLLSISSSVFAACRLDESRWKWLFSTDEYGLYYDRNTAIVKSASNFEVWICHYYPGNTSCGYDTCVKVGKSYAEHYHYLKTEFNSERYTITVKGMMIRDNKGNVIDSIDVPSYAQKSNSITPDSIGEDMMLKIKQDLYKYR